MIVNIKRAITILSLALAATFLTSGLVLAQEEIVNDGVVSAVENSAPYEQEDPNAKMPPLEGQPALKMPTAQFDFGKVDPGSTITHEFTVENTGEADLRIISVEPGCGCSVASFDEVIKPGAKGKVAISVEIYPQWAGESFSKQAMMVTNDAMKKHTILTVSGEVLLTPAKK